MTRRNIEIPPLSAQVIKVDKCYGQDFNNFLRKCSNLKELRINTDIFPGAPHEIGKGLQSTKIEVFWQLKKPWELPLFNTYQMKHGEWEFVKTMPDTSCASCGQLIVGLFWECRIPPTMFQVNLCDACKDKGCHGDHTHAFGREFDERERLTGFSKEAEGTRFLLPFVKAMRGLRQMVVCSGCKDADVTLFRFECQTCVNFHLCKLCKEEYPHKHDLKKKVYQILKRCSYCQGKIHGNRFEYKSNRNYILCETCYRGRGRSLQEFEEIKEPIHIFKLRRCENCKVTGDMNKVWFRCDTCDCFLLCERCKDEGLHKEHNLTRQHYRDVYCEDCGIDTVLLFRCITCTGRNLCIRCQAVGHKRHKIEEVEATEIKHQGFRCGNCKHQICGIRYKCTSCCDIFNTFNFCKFCKDLHQQEHSFEEEPIIVCSFCRTKHSDVGFRCKVCPYYTLCESCNRKGIHRKHRFEEIHKEEVYHIGVECKICLVENVYGSRFKCTVCIGFDICQECKYKGMHSEHKLIEIKDAELYHEMQCDQCFARIYDIRYKCNKCKKYKLCKYCINRGSCRGHKFVEDELTSSSSSCTRCGRMLFDSSFKCENCTTCIICKNCQLTVTNNCKHEFDELRKKDVQHKYIHCNLCKKYQFRGIRYRCKTCKWYNLCEVCKESGHHQHHEFDEWKTSQFLPGPGNFETNPVFEPISRLNGSRMRPRLPYVY